MQVARPTEVEGDTAENPEDRSGVITGRMQAVQPAEVEGDKTENPEGHSRIENLKNAAEEAKNRFNDLISK